MTAPARPETLDHAAAPVGTERWVHATGGNLSARERRSLLRPILKAQATNASGRLSMALGLSAGRRAHIDEAAIAIPDSAPAREAEQAASDLLTPMLLAHSARTYVWGAALASLEQVAFDRELLWVAAMFHDTGLPAPTGGTDFTARSVELLETSGLAGQLDPAARTIVGDAMCGHHTPGLTLAAGAESYLLSAGAAVDVFGLRSWELPPAFRRGIVDRHPRHGFKRDFTAMWKAEARAVPRGRAQLLRRWAAADLAIKLAPYAE